MIGDHAIVIKAQNGETLVDFHGEIWQAVSSAPLHAREEVVIKAVNGLLLTLAPIPALPNEKGPP